MEPRSAAQCQGAPPKAAAGLSIAKSPLGPCSSPLAWHCLTYCQLRPGWRGWHAPRRLLRVRGRSNSSLFLSFCTEYSVRSRRSTCEPSLWPAPRFLLESPSFGWRPRGAVPTTESHCFKAFLWRGSDRLPLLSGCVFAGNGHRGRQDASAWVAVAGGATSPPEWVVLA